MVRTCSRCVTENITDGGWQELSNLSKKQKEEIKKKQIQRETYFKQDNGKKYYWRCENCIVETQNIKNEKKQRLKVKKKIEKRAAKGLSLNNENSVNDYVENLVRSAVKRKSQQQDGKLDDVSGRLLQTEQNVVVCQSNIQSLQNSDIEQNKEIRATQTQANQNTEDIKQNKEDIKETKEENKQLKTQTSIIWNKVFSTKKPPKTIYDFDTIWHWIGWPIFLILAGYISKKVHRAKTKKIKITKNYLAEIRAIFKEWQLNMYASTGGYVVGFYLIKEAIDKWINPHISGWIAAWRLPIIALVCLFIGIGFYLDGLITSSLKTPLQRLSIKIENANIDEKVKKSLLSKTQKVNELFKETLKRFGLLAVVGILTNLIKEFWNEHILTLLSYAVPILGALKIIWEVDKSLKKLKLSGSEKN